MAKSFSNRKAWESSHLHDNGSYTSRSNSVSGDNQRQRLGVESI